MIKFGWYIGQCMQEYSGYAHCVKLFVQTWKACSPDSIDTFISLIWPNLAEIWACAHKHNACMRTSLCASIELFAQTGLACSPDSEDTLISLIQPNLTEIWACAHQKIVCMHASMGACLHAHAQTSKSWPACHPDSIYISIPPIWPKLAGLSRF